MMRTGPRALRRRPRGAPAPRMDPGTRPGCRGAARGPRARETRRARQGMPGGWPTGPGSAGPRPLRREDVDGRPAQPDPVARAEHGLEHDTAIDPRPVPAGKIAQDQPTVARHDPGVVAR